MADDDFELWLGRIGSEKRFSHQVLAAVNRAGGRRGGSRSTFSGSRIGRGFAAGRMYASGHWARATNRRVVVKARIVKLAGKGLGNATAHLRYLQRDGTARTGERGALYGRDGEAVDGKAFLERADGDRHQFRFIVAPEDGAEYRDLKELVRVWIERVEQDLGTSLDWVAVDHFNTGHPHSHVIVRGKDHLKKDLILAREYLTHGLRARAEELVELQLGPRSPEEMLRAAEREIDQERFTGIDRRLIAAVGEDGVVRAAHKDAIEQSLRAGRLQTLGRMGLATEQRRGVWRLADDIEPTLRLMGQRNDIIRTMQREMRDHAPERAASDHVIHDPAVASAPITGRVIARGLSDEVADRHYLIVDGTDGLSHYVDIGVDATETRTGSIVRVSPTPIAVRQVDRTIAEVAAANGGRYSIDAHLRHDPSAQEAFAETHVRRLEAIRRATGAVKRLPDGSWTIAPNHLDRVETYERRRAEARPVTIETVSAMPLDRQAGHNGETWLDREMATDNTAELGRGFGADVRRAMVLRQQWLVDQQLAEVDGETIRFRANMLGMLRQREFVRVGQQLAAETGLMFSETRAGQDIAGTYRRSVMVGDAKYAVVERARDFTLVPWRPALERSIGKPVSGIMREAGVSWTVWRGRSGPQVGDF